MSNKYRVPTPSTEEIRAFLATYSGPAAAKLNTLRTHASARSINAMSILRAEAWLSAFQQVCGATWREPDVVQYDDVNEQIVFTWDFTDRMLVFFVTPQSIDSLKCWGLNTEHGIAATPEKRSELWQWLRAQE